MKLIVAFANFANACKKTVLKAGLDSALGIATCFGLDGQGVGTPGGGDYPHPSRPDLGPTQLSIQWVLGLSRG